MIMPSGSLAVLALNCLTKSMMFTPCGPSAVPTGGAGVAFPAGNCNFTVAWSFFAIGIPLRAARLQLALAKLRHLFHLHKIKFHRRRAAENRDGNFQRVAVGVHVVDDARKIRERPFDDAHLLVALEHQLRLGPVRGGGHAVQNVFHFDFGKRRGRLARTDESSDARRVADDVPGVVVHVHFHQDVAGIQHARGSDFLAAANFQHILGRNHHPADFILQPEGRHAALKALLHLLLKSRIGVDDVPLLFHIQRIPQCPKNLMTRWTSQLTPLSTPKKKTPKNATVTITTQVVTNTSCRVGQVTWRISTRTSCRKPRHRRGCSARRAKKPNISSGEPRPSVSSVFNFPTCVAIARFFLRLQPVSCACYPASAIARQSGRGGGIRTPTLGFGDRWSTVEPTPLSNSIYFTSLWPVCLRHALQNFFVSIRSECFFRFLVVV